MREYISLLASFIKQSHFNKQEALHILDQIEWMIRIHHIPVGVLETFLMGPNERVLIPMPLRRTGWFRIFIYEPRYKEFFVYESEGILSPPDF